MLHPHSDLFIRPLLLKRADTVITITTEAERIPGNTSALLSLVLILGTRVGNVTHAVRRNMTHALTQKKKRCLPK